MIEEWVRHEYLTLIEEKDLYHKVMSFKYFYENENACSFAWIPLKITDVSIFYQPNTTNTIIRLKVIDIEDYTKYFDLNIHSSKATLTHAIIRDRLNEGHSIDGVFLIDYFESRIFFEFYYDYTYQRWQTLRSEVIKNNI